jgi:hypothetical protein
MQKYEEWIKLIDVLPGDEQMATMAEADIETLLILLRGVTVRAEDELESRKNNLNIQI